MRCIVWRATILIIVLGTTLSTPVVAAADRVELKNGDRISGTISKLEDGKLNLKTGYAGDITIDWNEVVAIESTTPQRVELRSGKTFSATFVRRPGGIYISSDQLPAPWPLQLNQIVSIGLPGGPLWTASLSVSLSGTQGNTSTAAFGVSAEAQRKTKDDRLKVNVRTDNQTRSGKTEVQSTFGRGLYDYSLNDWWFLSAVGEFEHDRFKDLNLRTRIGGGPGWRFVKTNTMSLTTVLGASYVNENFRVANDRSFASGLVSEEFRWKVSDQQSVHQLLEFHPNVQKVKDFTSRFELGFRQTIIAALFADLGFIFEYDNVPAPGKKKEDLKYGLTLGYQF
ncbi:MAG: YdiY family protein [Candidatus Binatia bacterium]